MVEPVADQSRTSARKEPQRTVRILGVPMDLGQQRRGVDMGPSAVRYAGLQDRLSELGYIVRDSGNINVPVVEMIAQQDSDGQARHLDEVVRVCQSIYDRITAMCRPASLPSSWAAITASRWAVSAGIAYGGQVGVIWVDAHARLQHAPHFAIRQRSRDADGGAAR